jgi:outer membrane protein OmpA-like peptidoglycan-associated protein
MFKLKAVVSIALIGAITIITGCATTDSHYAGRKNHLVKDVPPGKKCDMPDLRPDWFRIANMTDEEICKAINCPERVVTKEVRVEVPGPERVVTKEVPVEKIVYRDRPVEKIVEKKPIFVLPGAFFDVDKSIIKPAGIVELNKAARTLKEAGNPAIVISGHTDSTASDEYNMGLSQRRADAVKAYLAKQGVPESSMSTIGYGKTKPVASNDTKDGKAQNRRVEIHLAN